MISAPITPAWPSSSMNSAPLPVWSPSTMSWSRSSATSATSTTSPSPCIAPACFSSMAQPPFAISKPATRSRFLPMPGLRHSPDSCCFSSATSRATANPSTTKAAATPSLAWIEIESLPSSLKKSNPRSRPLPNPGSHEKRSHRVRCAGGGLLLLGHNLSRHSHRHRDHSASVSDRNSLHNLRHHTAHWRQAWRIYPPLRPRIAANRHLRHHLHRHRQRISRHRRAADPERARRALLHHSTVLDGGSRRAAAAGQAAFARHRWWTLHRFCRGGLSRLPGSPAGRFRRPYDLRLLTARTERRRLGARRVTPKARSNQRPALCEWRRSAVGGRARHFCPGGPL